MENRSGPLHLARRFPFWFTFLATFLFSFSGLAAEVWGNEGVRFGVHGVVRGGLVTDPPPDGADLGPLGADADLARLGLSLEVDDSLRIFSQIEAHTGDVQLFDALLDWQITRALMLRVGRFRTPVSGELFFQGLPHGPMRNRPAAVFLAPLRSDGAIFALGRPDGRIRPEIVMGLFWGDLIGSPRALPNMATAAFRLQGTKPDIQTPVLNLSVIYDDEADLQVGTEATVQMAGQRADQQAGISPWLAYRFYVPGGDLQVIPAAGLDFSGPTLTRNWQARTRGEIRVGFAEHGTWLRFGTLLGPGQNQVETDTYLLLQVGLD
jgi:hypothetical protein